ncbi:MAG: FeoB-associated Cys-rich membrane protein [Clostridiales Family XIII bacterium]|jgi:hypothetical protein|nr:FeoB-associated Cys-rich membrane protein [Clostridiales Family XIII bacterium]
MLQQVARFLALYGGTVLVGFLVAAAVAGAAIKVWRDRARGGKCACCDGCAGCPGREGQPER